MEDQARQDIKYKKIIKKFTNHFLVFCKTYEVV
jgi:hypothetical protein